MPAGLPERRGAVPGASRPGGVLDPRKVREWAKGQGIDIKERGRVPAEVIEKYKAGGA